jgi:hypothetical protein
MSQINANAILDANGGNTATINSMTPTADSLQGFRNRIINGDMRIDQRNAGASVTPTTDSVYTLDRWFIRNTGGSGRFSVVRSTTSAANFPNSVLLTNTTTSVPSGSEFYGLGQNIEGYNISDFAWGTANAQDITISFQVRSSLTGTYCVSVRNEAADRSFVSEFTINSADTFETKTVTIPGETSGSWASNQNAGILFLFCLGSASGREGTAGSWQTTNIVATSNQVDWINTSGATFYITGVQLEVGSVATPFERRPFGTELALCQRYFVKWGGETAFEQWGFGIAFNTTSVRAVATLPVQMRTQPSATGSLLRVQDGANGISINFGSVANGEYSSKMLTLNLNGASGLTQWRPYFCDFQGSTSGYLYANAEL